MKLNKMSITSLALAPFLTVSLFPLKAGITHFPETFQIEQVNGANRYVGYTHGEHTIKLTSLVNPPAAPLAEIKSVRSVHMAGSIMMVFYSLQNNSLGTIAFRGDAQTSLAKCKLVWTTEEQVLECDK